MKSHFRHWVCSTFVMACAGCGTRAPGHASSVNSQSNDGAVPAAEGDGGIAVTDQDASIDDGNRRTVDVSAVDTGNAADAAVVTDVAVVPNDTGTVAQDGAAATPPLDDSQTLVPDPSWTCGMPMGIPPLTGAPLVFEADLTIGDIHDIGQTQFGQRTLIEIKGGTLSGPQIHAQFQNFGLDWQLTLSNGVVEDEEVDVITADDGTNIFLRVCGTSPGPGGSVRIVPDFEAPTASSYAWLNSGVFAGTREFDPIAKTLKVTVYDVSSAPPAKSTVNVNDPPGTPNQTWECKTASGTETTVVYTETVGIASGTISVGASKRGTRSAIPITGGTTSGRIQGSVLAGGADFPLMATNFVIDARYTLQTADGELIIVRNCGPLGSLVPVFETRTDGSYAWVNDNRWLSSDPSVGAGVVNLTIYDTQ